MTPIIHVQLPLAVLPLESYHAMLPVDARPTLESLCILARKGRLPGAFQMPKSSIWYINQVAAMQFGLPDIQEPTENNRHEKTEGIRISDQTPGALPRKVANSRERRTWASEDDV